MRNNLLKTLEKTGTNEWHFLIKSLEGGGVGLKTWCPTK